MATRFDQMRSRLLGLAERRLPALTRLRKAEELPLRLDRRRIYVLPTRFGSGFGILLFVMLLGALNYGNNPAFLLTCLLGAAAWASLFFGFRSMSGLQVMQLRAREAHAGDTVPVRLMISGGNRMRPSLRIDCGGNETAFGVSADKTSVIALSLPGERRGWMRAGRMRIWTDYPLGLFKCWSWINPAVEFLIYAKPEHPLAALPPDDGRIGERPRTGSSEDYAGLREYRASDPPRLIAWKASARHDVLLVREIEHRAGEALVFDFAALGDLGTEQRISRLTAWVLAAEDLQQSYTLRLRGIDIGPGSGGPHRQACLKALALFADR